MSIDKVKRKAISSPFPTKESKLSANFLLRRAGTSLKFLPFSRKTARFFRKTSSVHSSMCS
jgi:hypothetical protein